MADSFPKPIRLSLVLSPELNSTLEDLAKQIHGTKSDVLRKAIALMELAVRAKSEGRRIGIAKPDEELAIEVVGI
jgi:predicted transcriptional regulator